MLDPAKVLSYYRQQTPEMLTLLGELVERESPSLDKEAVDRAGDWVETELAMLPVEVERLPLAGNGDVLRVRRNPDPGQPGPTVLLLTHIDTVWPLGELERRPFKVEGGRACGPGCADNKNGLTVLLAMIQGLRDMDVKLRGPVVALINGDEEIGSVTSSPIIKEEMKRSNYVLSLEAARADGKLVTSRKAVGRFNIDITGKAAHSGVSPEEGVSAIVELAEQIREMTALSDPAHGIAVNVGVVTGGERANMVAAKATAAIDLRAPSTQAGAAVAKRILQAKPHRQGVRVEVTGRMTRPALARTEQVAALFELARKLGARIGLDLAETGTGGGGDASFASEINVPTLDGLGGVGDGGHSDNEYILVDSLAERAALLTLLVEHLSNEGA